MVVKEYPTVLKEEEKLTVRLEDMGLGRKKKLGSGSDISKEERIACEEAQGLCANLLVAVSLLLVFATLPLSLCFVIKVVQADINFSDLLEMALFTMHCYRSTSEPLFFDSASFSQAEPAVQESFSLFRVWTCIRR